MTVTTRPDIGPFVYDGRPYERVASTTRRMAQTKYDKRLLDRAHRTWRWEDEPADYSGYVAIVVFDDRIEIRSYGRLPSGITVKKLSGKHDSKPVNPLIAGAFHRTGAVEVWGRGTNRVIEMCRQHGAALPVFEEREGFATHPPVGTPAAG